MTGKTTIRFCVRWRGSRRALPKNSYLVKVIRWLPGNVITGASAVRAGTAADAHGVVMVALGALSARPAAPALARTARRPPSAARASFARGVKNRRGSRSRFGHLPRRRPREKSRRRARVRRVDRSRLAALPPTRFRSRRSVRRGARAPGARARRRRRRRRRGRRRGGGVYYTRRGGRAGAVPAPWHRFLTRTTFVVAAMVVLYSASTPYGVNDQGVSFRATATAKRLACVFSRARGGEPRRRQSRARDGGDAGRASRRRCSCVFRVPVRDWPRRSSCMSRRRTSRFCGFSRRWTVKARSEKNGIGKKHPATSASFGDGTDARGRGRRRLRRRLSIPSV